MVRPIGPSMGPWLPDPATCSRDAYLEEKRIMKEEKKAWKDCEKRRRLPGYETLMSARYVPTRR